MAVTRPAALCALVVLLAGCALPEPSGSTPSPSPSAMPSPTSTTSPTDPPIVTREPTGSAPQWRREASAPTPRSEVAVATMGSLVFVAGGFGANGAATNVVEVLDAATGEWSDAPPLPQAIHHAMAITYAGQVLVLGGNGADGKATAGVHRLDETGWTRLADMPQPRAAGAVAHVGEEILVAGGIDGRGGLSSTAYLYDGIAWREAPAFERPRDHLAAATLDGIAYFVGGRILGLSQNRGELDAFDGTRWTRLADMPTPRGGLAAAAWNGSLVVLGGEEPGGTFDEAEAFTPATGTWNALPAMPTARHGLGAATIDGRLYALLGGERPGGTASGIVESYGPAG